MRHMNTTPPHIQRRSTITLEDVIKDVNNGGFGNTESIILSLNINKMRTIVERYKYKEDYTPMKYRDLLYELIQSFLSSCPSYDIIQGSRSRMNMICEYILNEYRDVYSTIYPNSTVFSLQHFIIKHVGRPERYVIEPLRILRINIKGLDFS